MIKQSDEIELVLAPQGEVKPNEINSVKSTSLEESGLSEAELKTVRDFASKIDLTDTNMVLQYGAMAQQKMSDFSNTALNSVRTKDLGEVGGLITELVVELKNFDVDEEDNGIFGFFKKTGNKIASIKTRYNKAEVNVEKISSTLQGHQIQLMKDVAMLDQMYDRNLHNFKELSMYILAGKHKFAIAKEKELPELIRKANLTKLPEDSQEANDFSALCDRFEKKLHDLELTRMVSIQMAPQIRLVQGSDSLMAEKIQSTLVNTIPLWKSQMVLALGINHSQEAMEAQRAVSNMTNELLKKNADRLKTATIETAKESERGIIDIETLKHTNQALISTLDEVIKIQQDGREKRKAAQDELVRIEGELKNKLLDIRA